MPRVPFVERENLDPEGQDVWDQIAGPRGGTAHNWAALLNNPVAAGKLAQLGVYARVDTPLDKRVKYLAILTAAREAGGHHIWTANQRSAKAAGLPDDVIDAILQFRAPVGLDPSDSNVVQFVQELLRHHCVSDHTFDALRDQIGIPAIIDMLVVCTYYYAMSHCIQALEVVQEPGLDSALTYLPP
ncbi:carboxymuconolactone decarboxylase family protein [SAR202 cluster bacterium AD-804-J14_MRT_500m]|nr:carboxymuconolactone decarboxylase family protein [SAR202 cluster bacterium AD-804-J14_MRT_500m]